MAPRALFRALCASAPLWAAWAAPAGAQDADASILGSWAFQTDVYSFGCQMEGSLVLRRGATDNLYTGRLVAEETCPGVPHYHAEQAVTALRHGGDLKIDAKLVRVTPSPENYLPDDFSLVIMASDLMVGELRSADVAPVTFRRNDPAVG